MVRTGTLDEFDRSFDYEFWQSLGSSARFAAAWEMAKDYHVKIKGGDERELRLQRTVVLVQPQPG